MIGEKSIKFKSGEEMYDFLIDGSDLYNPEEEVYVYEYNDHGSINVYSGISPEYARELDSGEYYWGAYLGWYGSAIHDSSFYKLDNPDIYDDFTDDALLWCEGMYQVGDWFVVTK